MPRTLALAVLLALAWAQAVVTLYPSFAEVRIPLDLPPAPYLLPLPEGLIPGSLELLGVEEEARFYTPNGVAFRYKGQGRAQLRYLTQGVRARVYYTLAEGRLTAWARVEGGLSLPPGVGLGSLGLVAGEVRLEGEAPTAVFKALDREAGPALAPGVFRYTLPPILPQAPATEIAFARAGVALTRFLRYQGPFATAPLLPLERGYGFRAPFPLAPGPVSVLDQGLFLGQAGLPLTPKDGEVRFFLGQDLEAQASRSVNRLETREKEALYQVQTRFQNPYPHPVELLLEEAFPTPFRLEGLPPGAELLPQGYRLRRSLAPGEAWTLVYRVALPR